jgi:DNA polymerase
LEKSGYLATQLRSNIKFAALIRELGLEPPLKISVTTGKQTYAFAKGDVGYQQFVNDNPEYNHIWEARASEKSTIDRTRAQRFLDAADPDTRKMSIPLNYYGAHTGRASGGDKLNFQNLKRGSTLRKALVAPEGHQVVVADSSNIEARVLAWLAKQHDIIEQYEDGKDVYCSFADKIFPELAPTNKKDHPFERFLGKVCILGLGYGMGWRKFQATLKAGALGNDPIDLTDQKAQDIVTMYRESNMKIAALWKTLDLHLYKMRSCKPDKKFSWEVCDIGYQYIGLPNGMRLTYPGLRKIASAEAWRTRDGSADEYAVYGDQELVSNNVVHPDTPDREFALHKQTRKTYGAKVVENLVQALARIIVMDQMLDIDEKYPVVLTVHDEVICVVPDDQAQTALDFMITTMSTAPKWAEGLPLAAEGGFDTCYSK